MTSRLLFVYGTLRPGEPNHHLVADAVTHRCPALLDAHALYVDRYPYAVAHPGRVVVGDLLHVSADGLAATLRRCDLLEGYVPGAATNPYERCLRPVWVPDAGGLTPSAWVYVAGATARQRLQRGGRPPLTDGDWRRIVARPSGTPHTR